MVPSVLLERATLPLTAQAKLDRRALAREVAAALAAEGGASAAGFVPPRTEAEELLAELWTELLGCSRVGADDNFFDLGGNSLHATRHMYRLQEMLSVELPIRALYEARTLAQLALRVETELLGEPA
jgi:acyl carrier protein